MRNEPRADLEITWDWDTFGNDGSGAHLLDDLKNTIYDATNGTISKGDNIRTSRGQED